MNKKVLTLCAGFVLAGGMLSSLSAEQLSKVANDGKYYKIGRLSNYDSSSNTWGEASGSYCLDLNEGKAGLTQEGPTNYWRVAKASEDGMYHLINMKGDTLYVNTHKTFGFNEVLPGNNGTKVPYTQLYYMEDGKQVWVSHESQNPTGFYALGVQGEDLNVTPGIAFDAMKDTDNTALKNALLEDGVESLYMFGTAGNVEEAIRSICKSANTTEKGDLAKVNAVIYISESEGSKPNQAIVLGDAIAPAGINYSTITIAVNGTVTATPQNVIWGVNFPETFRSEGKDNKVVLVWGGSAVRAHKDANGEVKYMMGNYDPNSTNGNEASEYFFTLTPFETSANTYEIRLKDKFGQYLKADNNYVVVANVGYRVNKTNDGTKYEYRSSATGNQWKEMDGENVIFPQELELMTGSNWVNVDWSTNSLSSISPVSMAHAFGIAKIREGYMYAETLLQRYGEYFTLKIEYDKDGDGEDDTDLTSIFAGELTPVKNVKYNGGNTSYDLADPKATEFMLMNEKNEILVLTTDPTTTWSSGTNIHAYKLDKVSAKALELDTKNYYQTTFRLKYIPGITPSQETSIDAIEVYVDGEGWKEIGCYLDKQVPELAGTGNTGALKDVTITLNASAVVDAPTWLNAPVYYTVTVKNANKKAQHYGKVLGLDEDGSIEYVAPENIDQTMPEGQFAIKYIDWAKDQWGNPVPAYYEFTNRENQRDGFTVRASDFYEVDMAKNLFAYRDYMYNLMDTLEIAPVNNYTSEDGFKRFTAADLNNNTYTIAMKLLNGDSLNVVENHNDKHRVGLDENNATEWRIEMSQVKLIDATNDFLRYVPDTVTIETPIRYFVAGKGWKETTATDVKSDYYKPATALKICTYILKNTDNNEYLYGYDYEESKGNDYYVCDKYENNATRIAFKKIGDDGTLNLVPAYSYGSDWWNIRTVYEDSYVNYAKSLRLSYNKIIGGTTSLTGVLKDEQYLYKAPTNDLFVINVAEAPTYKKMDQGSKIIISRLANNDEVIYEAGEFAGISNRAAYKDIKPTLYVDTAYVNRAGNFAYQYLLGVNINRIDTTYECNIPAHGIHKEDTTYGRFLVNMVDSAKACKDVHNNKFVYDGEYKLAFVEGYRTNDTLFFTNEADKVVSSMKIGDANSNIAKFAFKMIDEEANEFVIETGTGYINKEVVNGNGTVEVISEATVPGYLRWVNGNLVVTTNIEKAERFTMEASDKEATANENISAGNVVVAGVDGAVVVKGAEGKNVIVSTILGKVVANEVVSSDNATIAAPAGIVVVSVDGESFKVVVK